MAQDALFDIVTLPNARRKRVDKDVLHVTSLCERLKLRNLLVFESNIGAFDTGIRSDYFQLRLVRLLDCSCIVMFFFHGDVISACIVLELLAA